MFMDQAEYIWMYIRPHSETAARYLKNILMRPAHPALIMISQFFYFNFLSTFWDASGRLNGLGTRILQLLPKNTGPVWGKSLKTPFPGLCSYLSHIRLQNQERLLASPRVLDIRVKLSLFWNLNVSISYSIWRFLSSSLLSCYPLATVQVFIISTQDYDVPSWIEREHGFRLDLSGGRVRKRVNSLIVVCDPVVIGSVSNCTVVGKTKYEDHDS